jgi:outer membrane receptor protein involved in Fe transport
MNRICRALTAVLLAFFPSVLHAQGVTTSSMSGIVTDRDGVPLPDATVTAVHLPSNTSYRALVRAGGAYTIPNMRIGGPYRVTVAAIGFQPLAKDDIQLALGQVFRYDARLERQVVQIEELEITETRDQVLSAGRTGAATSIEYDRVLQAPSVKRSTRDLTRLDPRSDGNFSFAGRNWLYNSISVDGSYFNNSFGLDDPAPGGQANAEPIPFDAVEQVQVSIAPFDVRQGGFTGASVNTVTRSGTNNFTASLYSFFRNDALQGNKVRGSDVVANPDLSYLQSGVSFSGPIIRDKLFFFINGEVERTDDPGTNFVACSNNCSGTLPFGVSRVSAETMDNIRQRLIDAYDYDPGPYQGYINETDNNKLLLKLDWNVNEQNNVSFRYNYLDADRDLPPHPFVLSYNNTGRSPSSTTLPFRNSGYNMTNELHSFAGELNSRGGTWANRFFASYNRFRDFRTPFSTPFPTVEIGEGGVTYTTAGHEPFSIHNILDQDVFQVTNNLNLYRGRHTFTIGANYESYSFFNSFNIFRNGVFFLPYQVSVAGGSTFPTLAEFFAATDPGNPDQLDLNSYVGSGPFKGEKIGVSQYSLYGQDEFLVSDRFTLTLGLRVDVPTYRTDPVDNPTSRDLDALDENGNPETVDQSALPGAKLLWSPRVGFNWNAVGDRKTQVRGGTGIFTGKVPFVWVGNVISNPGANENLYPAAGAPQIPTSDDAILQQSFDLNAMDPDFKFPQVWTTDLAIDQQLGEGTLATLEVIYGKDLNAIYMRNADLVPSVRALDDGRPYYGGAGNNELNPDGGAGIYVIDNTSEGYNFNVTAQLRRTFSPTFSASLAYAYNQAKNNLKSTEIASVLWQNQPIQGNPNRPELSLSEFGQRHRIVGTLFGTRNWSRNVRTQVGLYFEVAEGSPFTASGGNRFSFIYSGDVNGDGVGGNDLIYIPRSQSEINFAGNAQAQWDAFNAFIEQDPYLSKHRGEIAERMGALNPWYHSVDLRILQDLGFGSGSRYHGFQLSLDVLNLTNLISSSWGVRKTANPLATSPLSLTGFNGGGDPIFNFSGATETYIDDLSLASRWRVQFGLRYFIQ